VYFDSTPWLGTVANGNTDLYTEFRTRQWQIFSKNRFLPERWTSTLRYGETVDDQMSHLVGMKSPLWTRTRQFGWQNDVRLPLGNLLAAFEQERQYVRADHHGMFGDDRSIRNNAFLAGWSANAGAHSWQVNARADRHSRYGHENTWGLAYGYRIAPELRARLSYGTAFKAPSLDQLYNSSYGNPDLGAEKARNREAALIWERDAQTASLTVYSNRVKDLIAWDSTPTPLSPWGGYANVGHARLDGATLAYSGRIKEWIFGASYDYLDGEGKDSAGHWVPLGRRARHSAKLSVDRAWNAYLQTGLEIASVGRRYDATYDKSTPNKEKLGGYTVFNLTASYALNPDLRLEARLNNIFDKKYETARYYNSDGGFNAFVGLRYAPK